MRDAEKLMIDIFKRTNPIAQFEKKAKDIFSKEVERVNRNLKEVINNRFSEAASLIEETKEFKELKKEIYEVNFLAELREDSKIDSFADKVSKLIDAIENILIAEVGAIVYSNKRKDLSFNFVDVKLPKFTVGSANGFSYILSNFSDYRRHFSPMYYNDYINSYNYYEIKSTPYTCDSDYYTYTNGTKSSFYNYYTYTNGTKSSFYNYYIGDDDSNDYKSTELALLDLLSIKKLTIVPHVSMMVSRIVCSQSILLNTNPIDLIF